jgi:hypothetical protein
MNADNVEEDDLTNVQGRRLSSYYAYSSESDEEEDSE